MDDSQESSPGPEPERLKLPDGGWKNVLRDFMEVDPEKVKVRLKNDKEGAGTDG